MWIYILVMSFYCNAHLSVMSGGMVIFLALNLPNLGDSKFSRKVRRSTSWAQSKILASGTEAGPSPPSKVDACSDCQQMPSDFESWFASWSITFTIIRFSNFESRISILYSLFPKKKICEPPSRSITFPFLQLGDPAGQIRLILVLWASLKSDFSNLLLHQMPQYLSWQNW